MCCAAVIGMFSLGGLHTEAALCDHKICTKILLDVLKQRYGKVIQKDYPHPIDVWKLRISILDRADSGIGLFDMDCPKP